MTDKLTQLAFFIMSFAFLSTSLYAQSRPNQCSYDISDTTISTQCYIMHEGQKIQGSGEAHFSGAGLSAAKSQACLKCRTSLATQISPEGGQVTLSADEPAQESPKIIDEAEELSRQKFSECLNNSYIKRQYPDTQERAKQCFDFASKQAESEVKNYREENCQRDSERSEVVTCKDGSRYKLVDINNLGGQVVDISRHSAQQLKKRTLGQQTQGRRTNDGTSR